MNEYDECIHDDDNSELVCRFQSSGINAISVTDNFGLRIEEVKLKVSEDLVYLL